MRSQHKSWLKRAAIPVALAFAAVSLAGCSTGASSSQVAQDSKATTTVWVDATRKPAVDAYKKAHPNAKVKVEVIDPGTYLSKIQLANRVGSGWPDVIFDTQPSEIASLQSPLFKYAQNISDVIPKTVQDNFATKNSICTVDGKLYCLQNDLAQDVMWYNKPLLEQFGYTLPTTWAEYADLGNKIATEHPGYVIGAAGGAQVFYDNLWGSGCPLQTVKSSTDVVINTADVKCTRVADLLDPLVKNGSVSRLDAFSPDFSKLAQSGKVLMLPAASWFGEYIFKPATGFAFKPGTLAAGAIPSWPGEKTNYSGAQGGGIWVVSAHSANTKQAADLAQWVTTADAYQGSAPTYPAYIPAAKVWLAKMSKDTWYAEDPSAVLTDAANKINPAEGATRYDVASAITNTIVASVKSGGTIASALPTLQSQLAGLAATAGYAVESK